MSVRCAGIISELMIALLEIRLYYHQRVNPKVTSVVAFTPLCKEVEKIPSNFVWLSIK